MKNQKVFLVSFFTFFLLLFSTSDAEAKVMWGKTELKKGQIGKVTAILSDTMANTMKNNTIQPNKVLKKGGEFRVYTYRVLGNKQFYGLGGGQFVQKTSKIKYETPSKAKLAQLYGELVIKIDKKKNSIFVNGITLGFSKQEVVNKLGIPDRKDEFGYDSDSAYIYLLKDRNTNKELELHVYYNKNTLVGISFDLIKNYINEKWYANLGIPFAVVGNVTYYYLEGTEHVLMFKPSEQHGYLRYADNNFYYSFDMEEKIHR